ncbi:MAG TPA: cell division protein ZapA [Dongiaceae bacterium]|jgi:cell division protein ZapA
MGKVHIVINNRGYDVACDDGQEAEVTELAQDLARRVDKLAQSVGQIGDARLLLMAALLIADELSSARKELERMSREGDSAGQDRLAESLERLASRVEAIAVRIEAA